MIRLLSFSCCFSRFGGCRLWYVIHKHHLSVVTSQLRVLTPMLRISVFQKEAHRAQIAALGLFEQGVLHAASAASAPTLRACLMRGSCVHQRRKVRTGTPICSQISACVRPCIASRCNRSSPLGLFHLLIWDSRARFHLRMRKRHAPASASRALRAEDDPCACVLANEKCRGGKGVKPAAGNGYFRRTAFSPVKSSQRWTITST